MIAKGKSKLRNYRLIVTSGPTREWMDPVRFISNPATGCMGWHLAEVAQKYNFCKVVYISGPGELAYRKVNSVQNISVDTTQEMCDALHSCLCSHCIIIMAAAPTDYQAKEFVGHKIKKIKATKINMEWIETVDILKSLMGVVENYHDLYRVGFAAETDELIEHAYQKLQAKDLDLICANQVYKDISGFATNNKNTLHVLKRNSPKVVCKLGPTEKNELAELLLDFIVKEVVC